MRLLLALLLLASTVSAAPPRFVAPGLRVTNLKASLAQDFTDHLAQQLVGRGLSVIASSDMQAILGIERQRQLLGCSDEGSSCMAELAGALGADGVVTGTVVRVGKKYQVNVRIIDARNARPLALYSEQADREEDLFGLLDLAAQALVNELQPWLAARAKQDKAAAPPALATAPPEEPPALLRTRPGARRLWWLPAASAGAFAIASGVFFGQAAAAHEELRTIEGARADYPLEATVARGQTFSTLGWVGAGLATASLVTMAGLLAFAEDEVLITVAPNAAGASFVVGGTW